MGTVTLCSVKTTAEAWYVTHMQSPCEVTCWFRQKHTVWKNLSRMLQNGCCGQGCCSRLSCCGCGFGAWVRGTADNTAAGSFPAFSFYSQTAHLCLFDVRRRGETFSSVDRFSLLYSVILIICLESLISLSCCFFSFSLSTSRQKNLRCLSVCSFVC